MTTTITGLPVAWRAAISACWSAGASAWVVAEAFGVGLLADDHDGCVGGWVAADRLRSGRRIPGPVRTETTLGAAAWMPSEHRRARRDLVGRAHAADVIAGAEDALPAHAPAAELVRHRVRARPGDDELGARGQWQSRRVPSLRSRVIDSSAALRAGSRSAVIAASAWAGSTNGSSKSPSWNFRVRIRRTDWSIRFRDTTPCPRSA